MKWFKFYGQDYLCDQKMLALTASERSCWITLMCYGSINDNANDNGMITFLSEEQLMSQAGLSITDEEWDKTVGVLKKFEKLKMIRNDNGVITILNWTKRQETSLTPYERVKRHREKKRNDNANDNGMITTDKNRIDKKREERETPRIENPKKQKIQKSDSGIGYLRNIPEADIEEFILVFRTGKQGVEQKAKSLLDYCEAKGKTYKNYKAFLRNALRKDFGERTPEEIEQQKCTTEALKRFHAQNPGLQEHVNASVEGVTEEERKTNLSRLDEMKKSSGIGKNFKM